MSIRSALQVAASPSDKSTDLADSEGTTTPESYLRKAAGVAIPVERAYFMQEDGFPPNNSRKLEEPKALKKAWCPFTAGKGKGGRLRR
jgi:hypothetical protein